MASRILITGISGSLAQLCAEKLLEDGHEIIGVDYRRRPLALNPAIQFFKANYNKRMIEDVFKRHPPQKVLHLGRVGNLKTASTKRFDLNVIGSAKIMELCLKHEVERLVVLSTFHIYGAHPHNHIPISEEEPLRAALRFPQLSDAVQLDTLATQWVYRHRRLRSVVLRPCNIVGPNINNSISQNLRKRNLPYLLGFNPMWQFVHESDMVQALMLTLCSDQVGVYNVAGGSSMPVVDAIRLTGAQPLPIPSSMASLALKLGRNRTIPPYFLDFLKYPCVIVDRKFREEFGYLPKVDAVRTLESTVQSN